MKTLDQQDPPPEFCHRGFWPGLEEYGEYTQLPESERQKKAWADACKKADGEDWVLDRDASNPHVYVNGRGERKYCPPDPTLEPVVADIPIPCVFPTLDLGMWVNNTLGKTWVSDKDGWYSHTPGDPMPCDPDMRIHCQTRDGWRHDHNEKGDKAEWWDWDNKIPYESDQIIAWKPA
jgi:hypothetical protein